ncbi:Uncharacterized protein GBIM_02933, partial [Gryllus bimaculatus]
MAELKKSGVEVEKIATTFEITSKAAREIAAPMEVMLLSKNKECKGECQWKLSNPQIQDLKSCRGCGMSHARRWYDRKIIGEFREIVDVTFVGAMCPPGGGRNPITPRLLRHFHYLAFIELEDNSKSQIFGTILQSWLRRAEESVQALNAPLVKASMSVYSTIVTELLPTPAKTHYTFNLRDLSKVFQGMLMCKPNNIK